MKPKPTVPITSDSPRPEVAEAPIVMPRRNLNILEPLKEADISHRGAWIVRLERQFKLTGETFNLSTPPTGSHKVLKIHSSIKAVFGNVERMD
jgi:hypothetical protein